MIGSLYAILVAKEIHVRSQSVNYLVRKVIYLGRFESGGEMAGKSCKATCATKMVATGVPDIDAVFTG